MKVLVNKNKVSYNSFQDTHQIYYNVSVRKQEKKAFSPASFNISRTAPIIQKPSDYELTITRFNIPSRNIPIFVWGSGNYQPEPSLPNYNPNSKVNKYFITFSYGGVDVTQALEFIPNGAASFYGDAIWIYQQMVDIINQALSKLFWSDYPTNTVRRFPTAPPTQPPFLYLDETTKLFTVKFEDTYNTGTDFLGGTPATPTIEIYFNSPFLDLFGGFNVLSNPTDPIKTYQILVRDDGNNTNAFNPNIPVGQIYMTQEYVTLASWTDLKSIVFTSDTIPLVSELQPTIKDDTRRILTDFIPNAEIRDDTYFQYNAFGFKRYYSLYGSSEIYTLNLNIYWEDKTGELFPIYIDGDQEASIKILFQKKTDHVIDKLLSTNKNKIND